MSIPLVINGQTFNYPQTDDVDWGPEATDWAAAVTSGMLQKAGGLFQLLAEADFGTGFGLKSIYFKSRTSNPADAGQIRFAHADVLSWRNQANSGNLNLSVDASDNLLFNGAPVGGFVVADTPSIDMSYVGGSLSADLILSAASAAAGFINAVASIETDGLQVQVPIADTSTTGVLTSTDWNTFNGKQAAGNYLTALTGEGTASGPGSAALTLSNAAVIAKVLTGYVAGAGTVSATDSILQAIEKLDGNDSLAVLKTGSTMTGDITFTNTHGLQRASGDTINIGTTQDGPIILGNTTAFPTSYVQTPGTLFSHDVIVDNQIRMLNEKPVKFYGTGIESVSLQSPTTLAADVPLILPPTVGTSGQLLTTDGTGIMSWTTPLPNVATISSTSTITNANAIVLANAAGGNITITLPTAVGIKGKSFLIKKIDSTTNGVNIGVTSSQTIDGASYTRVMTFQNQFIEFTSDNANWVISNYSTAGEVISSTNSASPASTVYGDATFLTPALGTWSFSLQMMSTRGGGGTMTELLGGITTTSGNSATGLTDGVNYFRTQIPNCDYICGSVPSYAQSITTTTTYYAKCRTITTTTVASCVGTLRAIRLSF